jgi:Tol biopolymer transport system component
MMTRSARRYPVVLAVAVILATMGLASCSDEPTAPPVDTASYRVAFLSDRDGNVEIYVMNSDGTGQMCLTNNSGNDRTFARSPDGSRIVFVSDRTGIYELYMMRPDGSFQTRLTTSTHVMGEIEAVPAWSSDGTQIAFCSGRDRNQEVYVMNADGSDERNVTPDSDHEDYDPAWRSDGLMITYVSTERAPPNMYGSRRH